MYDFIKHQPLYQQQEDIIRLMFAYVDSHIPLVSVLERTSDLSEDWEKRYHPDLICPCTQTTLPDAVTLLILCTWWGETQQDRQPLVHILTKSIPQLCQVRWLWEIMLHYNVTQQTAFGQANPAREEEMTELNLKMMALNGKRGKCKEKPGSSIVLEHQWIPESDDVLEFVRRLVLCTLLGNYNHAKYHPEFMDRLKLYQEFSFDVTRLGFTTWLRENRSIAFYALKEYTMVAVGYCPALESVIRSVYHWNNYTKTLTDGCDAIIRFGFGQNKKTLADTSEQLRRNHRLQLKSIQRKIKKPFVEFFHETLRKFIKENKKETHETWEDYRDECKALVPADKLEILSKLIPRFKPDEGIPWDLLVYFGLSTVSMCKIQYIENCHKTIIPSSKLINGYLRGMSSYAIGMSWTFFEMYKEFFEVRLYNAPLHWYHNHVQCWRLRTHTPPGYYLPETAGEVFYCQTCKSIRCSVLPPGDGSARDIETVANVNNGKVTRTKVPKNKKRRKRSKPLARRSKAVEQHGSGYKFVMMKYCPPNSLKLYCANKENNKKANNLCGRIELMRFNLLGRILQFQHKMVTLCCCCGKVVIFEMAFYRGDRYRCKFCQRLWKWTQEQRQQKLEKIIKRREFLVFYFELFKRERLIDVPDRSVVLPEEQLVFESFEQRIKAKDKEIQEYDKGFVEDPRMYILPQNRKVGVDEFPAVALDFPEEKEEIPACDYCCMEKNRASNVETKRDAQPQTDDLSQTEIMNVLSEVFVGSTTNVQGATETKATLNAASSSTDDTKLTEADIDNIFNMMEDSTLSESSLVSLLQESSASNTKKRKLLSLADDRTSQEDVLDTMLATNNDVDMKDPVTPVSKPSKKSGAPKKRKGSEKRKDSKNGGGGAADVPDEEEELEEKALDEELSQSFCEGTGNHDMLKLNRAYEKGSEHAQTSVNGVNESLNTKLLIDNFNVDDSLYDPSNKANQGNRTTYRKQYPIFGGEIFTVCRNHNKAPLKRLGQNRVTHRFNREDMCNIIQKYIAVTRARQANVKFARGMKYWFDLTPYAFLIREKKKKLFEQQVQSRMLQNT